MTTANAIVTSKMAFPEPSLSLSQPPNPFPPIEKPIPVECINSVSLNEESSGVESEKNDIIGSENNVSGGHVISDSSCPILPDSSVGNSLIPTDFYKVLKSDKDQDVHTGQRMH